MDNNSIISAIVSGVIAFFTSFITTKMTIKNDNKKYNNDLKRQEIKDKPKFKVSKTVFRDDSEADMSIVAAAFENEKDDNNNIKFVYDQCYKNNDELIHFDYIFKNVGKSAATELYFITTSPKNSSIILMEDKEDFLNHPFINYSELYDYNLIESGDSIKIRIYYHKDKIFSKIFSSPFCIVYKDEFGNYWEQPFFEREVKLYEPSKTTHKDLMQSISVEIALQCFENPLLW
ncbi:MAG: hypothetical protein IJ220_04685 [Clostridia bacterium]|nr:hypothetical protein [Clostridia bacterium]